MCGMNVQRRHRKYARATGSVNVLRSMRNSVPRADRHGSQLLSFSADLTGKEKHGNIIILSFATR
jgi:hypothetical protein